MKAKAALALCAGPAHHRRAGAHGGEARRRHPAPGDRGAALAGCRFADGARADPRRLGQLHHRTADRRAQRRGFPVHRRGAQGGRGRLAAHLDVADIVLVPHLGYSATGEVFNLAWEDARKASRWRCAPTSLMYTDRLPADRKGEVISELTADEAAALAGKKAAGLTPAAARALEPWRARSRAAWRAGTSPARAPGSLLLELFTHAGVGTMVHRRRGREAAPGEDRGRARHAGAHRAARGRRHAGEAKPRAARGRDRQLSRGRARRAHRRLRGALSLSRRQERRVRLPCGGSRIPRRRLRRAAAQGLRGAREEPALRKLFALTTHAAHWFLEQGFRAARSTRCPSAQGALQLAPRLEGLLKRI